MENICCKRGLCLILYIKKEIPYRLLSVIVIACYYLLYLYVHVNFYFQVHQGRVKGNTSLEPANSWFGDHAHRRLRPIQRTCEADGIILNEIYR